LAWDVCVRVTTFGIRTSRDVQLIDTNMGTLHFRIPRCNWFRRINHHPPHRTNLIRSSQRSPHPSSFIAYNRPSHRNRNELSLPKYRPSCRYYNNPVCPPESSQNMVDAADSCPQRRIRTPALYFVSYGVDYPASSRIGGVDIRS
jgi:hypothetical protein